ncbi:MAG: hypothetical protein ACI86M_001954 [Saprospiraceae bacterium]|jgi:hypothetical protein
MNKMKILRDNGNYYLRFIYRSIVTLLAFFSTFNGANINEISHNILQINRIHKYFIILGSYFPVYQIIF